MRRFTLPLLIVLVFACRETGGEEIRPVREDVVQLMRTVCNWQLDNPAEFWTWRNGRREYIDDDEWIRAVFHLGSLATWRATGEERYLQHTLDWAQRNEWLPGPRPRHADDHCIGQVYLELHDVEAEAHRIAGLRETMGRLRAEPRPGREEWSWCDALFMAGPTLAHLAAVTGDATYRSLLHTMWWDTVDYLYDEEHGLFYRDVRFKPQGDGSERREKDGTTIFWSRGNGWALAATARVLEHLPSDDPRKHDYVRLLRDVATAVIAHQREDGGWSVSLLAPDLYPHSETSGTALFCYAMAMGIRRGWLSSGEFQPAVEKAWQRLRDVVDEDGRVGFVQNPGDEPRKVFARDSVEFGTGTWLLAASEVAQLEPLKE